jgi:hypothetical protein
MHAVSNSRANLAIPLTMRWAAAVVLAAAVGHALGCERTLYNTMRDVGGVDPESAACQELLLSINYTTSTCSNDCFDGFSTTIAFLLDSNCTLDVERSYIQVGYVSLQMACRSPGGGESCMHRYVEATRVRPHRIASLLQCKRIAMPAVTCR